MDLFDKVSEDIKAAMKAKDKVALDTLRNIKKVFLEAKTAPGANDTLSDADAVKLIQKLSKQGKDAAEIYVQQGRQDLAIGGRAENHHSRSGCLRPQRHGQGDGHSHQAVGRTGRRACHIGKSERAAGLRPGSLPKTDIRTEHPDAAPRRDVFYPPQSNSSFNTSNDFSSGKPGRCRR